MLRKVLNHIQFYLPAKSFYPRKANLETCSGNLSSSVTALVERQVYSASLLLDISQQ